MNKELNHLLDTYTDNENFDYSCYISIENKLKALDIIINKQVDIKVLFNTDNFNDYNWFMTFNRVGKNENRFLTEEEYDLLKEVCKTCQS